MLDPVKTASPLSRTAYDRMIASGWLCDDKVELIRGVVVEMSPASPPHAGLITVLTELLITRLGDRVSVRTQCPFAASDDSEPEPDIAVVPRGAYMDDHPESAYLIIEVADSSLAKDRGVKLALYAECGIPEYWIVNMAERVIEIHTDPHGQTYRHRTTRTAGEVVSLIAFPDVPLAIPSLW